MDCKMENGLIQDYLDNSLNPVEKLILEEHLQNCEVCRKELTELKLLLWELEELRDSDIIIPPEALQIQSKVINEYLYSADFSSFGLNEFINTQKLIIEKSGMFLKFMPGVKFGTAYLGNGIKKTPPLLYKAIEGAFIGGKRLIMMRARA